MQNPTKQRFCSCISNDAIFTWPGLGSLSYHYPKVSWINLKIKIILSVQLHVEIIDELSSRSILRKTISEPQTGIEPSTF